MSDVAWGVEGGISISMEGQQVDIVLRIYAYMYIMYIYTCIILLL